MHEEVIAKNAKAIELGKQFVKRAEDFIENTDKALKYLKVE